jgi:hypothetical protein
VTVPAEIVLVVAVAAVTVVLRRRAAARGIPTGTITQLMHRAQEVEERTQSAEERWRATNAAKRAAGCPCGKPATEVEYMREVVGSVPAEFWRCADHADVTSWSYTDGGAPTPYWPRSSPCGTCVGRCSTTWKHGAGKPYQWHCPQKPGEGQR